METKKEIETKLRALLSIKKCRLGLSKEEEKTFNHLDNKYRNEEGHLVKGSFFVGSDSRWNIVK